MSANITDKLTDVRNSARPVTASVTGTRNAGGSSLTCDALTGWPTASKVHFVTYRVDSSSVPVAGTQLDCYGIVSGNAINSFTVVDGNDVGHAVGDKVEMLPTAAWAQDLADALTAQHTRTGGHKSVSTDTLTVTSGTTLPAGDIATADLAANAVTYPKLGAGATRLGLGRNAGGTLAATWSDYATVTATSNGGVVECEIGAQIGNGSSGADRTYDIRVLCDGVATTPAALTGLYAHYVAGATPYQAPSFNFSSTPAAGSHTWKLQLQASAGAAVILSNNYLKVAEVA